MSLFSRPDAGPAATAQAPCALPASVALEIVRPIAPPQIFFAWGPFPGVTAIDGQTGDWSRVGETRTPRLSDGGTVAERLVEVTPGVGFAYELTGFTDVFGRIVEGVRGEWTCTPDGDGCVIRWTWEFKPRPGRHAIVAALIVPLWRRYMARVVTHAARIAEQRA